MISAIDTPTATIIQFPVGGLRKNLARGTRPQVKPDASVGRYSDLAFGGGWYHDNAIQDLPDSTGKPA